MHSLSVKELREKFPLVRSELKRGETFLIIYKSKPIAKLTPLDAFSEFEEATDEDMEKASLADINNSLGDDFLTEEEVKYYLSL